MYLMQDLNPRPPACKSGINIYFCTTIHTSSHDLLNWGFDLMNDLIPRLINSITNSTTADVTA